MPITSGNRASFAIALSCLASVVSVWVNFDNRTAKLEKRVAQLEAEARVLAPLAQLLRGYQPEVANAAQQVENPYAASQACGAPDVKEPGDSPLAWRPAREDAGAEWLELHYSEAVPASEIRIYASFNPGAVVRVLGASSDGGELKELWSGESPKSPQQSIALNPPVPLSRLRVELDTSKVPGWNEIDAVALVDGNGAEHWAATAESKP